MEGGGGGGGGGGANMQASCLVAKQLQAVEFPQVLATLLSLLINGYLLYVANFSYSLKYIKFGDG